MTTTTCRMCGSDLPQRAATGRPPLYCGTGCRRAAEYERNRLNRHMEILEAQLIHARLHPDALRQPEREARLEAELARLQARLIDRASDE